MPRFLVEIEVESHIVATDSGRLRFGPADGSYVLHLTNLHVDPGIERPLVRAEVQLDAASADNAEDQAVRHLKRFLHILALVSGCRCVIHRVVRVMDWTPGLEMRPTIMYQEFPNPDVPMKALDPKLLATIQALSNSHWDEDLFRALRWFARGVAALTPEDQFAQFWFALEILAEHRKRPEKVPTACPQCQGPLQCPACNETPLHRPYPKQAIQDLIVVRTRGNPKKVFSVLDKIRNALMHGSDSLDISRELEVDFQKLTDLLGRIVWAELLGSFKVGPGQVRLFMMEPSTFAHFVCQVRGEVEIGGMPGADPTNPRLEDYPLPTINLEIMETPLEAAQEESRP